MIWCTVHMYRRPTYQHLITDSYLKEEGEGRGGGRGERGGRGEGEGGRGR